MKEKIYKITNVKNFISPKIFYINHVFQQHFNWRIICQNYY